MKNARFVLNLKHKDEPFYNLNSPLYANNAYGRYSCFG